MEGDRNMKLLSIRTKLGPIQTEIHEVKGTIPVIFLHGVYLDHHLWDDQIQRIKDHTVISIDMPHHGNNHRNILNWNLDDCASMLMEILDYLDIQQVIAIGQSWGSMTIIRAAAKAPTRFISIGLCNMPLAKGNPKKLFSYYLKSMLLVFRTFYAKQAAKFLFAPESLLAQPNLNKIIINGMKKMTAREIRQVDKAVVINPDDGYIFLPKIKCNVKALKGEKDYVPTPPGIETVVVRGGHISPLEAPDEVGKFIRHLLDII
jgi:pimeloyl-ACP methyl ester carboxylesterase